MSYFNFGSPGGGAPLQDSHGELVANLRGHRPRPFPPQRRPPPVVVHHPEVDERLISELHQNLADKVYTKYRHFKDAFIRMDRDRSGLLEIEELRKGLVRLGVVSADACRCPTVETLLHLCEDSQGGRVRYADFADLVEELHAQQPVLEQPTPQRSFRGSPKVPHARFHYANMTPESQLQFQVKLEKQARQKAELLAQIAERKEREKQQREEWAQMEAMAEAKAKRELAELAGAYPRRASIVESVVSWEPPPAPAPRPEKPAVPPAVPARSEPGGVLAEEDAGRMAMLEQENVELRAAMQHMEDRLSSMEHQHDAMRRAINEQQGVIQGLLGRRQPRIEPPHRVPPEPGLLPSPFSKGRPRKRLQ